MDINGLIGRVLYLLGFKPGVSTSIGGWTTKGYGKLDDNGFWQYPVNAWS